MPPDARRDANGWRLHEDGVGGVIARSRAKGRGRPVVLVHGIGPGTMGAANFGAVMEPLAARAEVHVLDLIGFGASDQKPEAPYFDVALWGDQIDAVLARTGPGTVLIGNSIGGALAFKAAGRNALSAVVSIGSPLRPFAVPEALRRFWTAPKTPADLAAAMAPMTASGGPPAPALVEARFAAFAAPGEAAHFTAMLADPAGAIEAAAVTPAEAAAIACPITVIHGRDDRAVPLAETALAFTALRPDADLVVFGRCGHNVTWERTASLLAVLDAVIAD